jgi:hypothetical protein
VELQRRSHQVALVRTNVKETYYIGKRDLLLLAYREGFEEIRAEHILLIVVKRGFATIHIVSHYGHANMPGMNTDLVRTSS